MAPMGTRELGPAQAKLAFLRWVGNSPGAATDEELKNMPDETMLETAIAHRIVGRALARMLEAKSSFSDRDVLQQLKSIFVDHQLHYTAYGSALERLVTTVNVRDEPIIAIKGNTLYHYSRDPFHIKTSGDIDLLVDRPDIIRTALASVGFLDEWMPAGHEEINIFFQDSYFDIHKYFPIYRIECNDPVPQYARDRHRHSGNLEVLELGYADIRPDASFPDNMKTPTVCYPSVTYAALICAMHLFTDFIRPYSSVMRFRPSVRVHEAFDFLAFLQQPKFSPQKFLAIVKRYQIEKEVELVGRLLFAILRDTSLFQLLGIAPKPEWREGYTGPLFLGFGFQYEVTLSAADIIGEPFGLVGAVDKVEPADLDLSGDYSFADLVGSGVSVQSHGEAFDWTGRLERVRDIIRVTLEHSTAVMKYPYVSITLGTDYYRYFAGTAYQIENRLITSAKQPHKMVSMIEGGKCTTVIEAFIPEPNKNGLVSSIILGNVHASSMTKGIFLPLRLKV